MTKRKPRSEVRKIVPGIKENISRRAGITHYTTTISPGADLSALGEVRPFVAKDQIREAMREAEKALANPKVPTESTSPLADKALDEEIILHGTETLKIPDEYAPHIQHAIDYGQAIFKRKLFAADTRRQERHGRKKRSKVMRPAVAELVSPHPNKTPLELWNFPPEALPHEPPTEPNAGRFVLWRDGDTMYALDENIENKAPEAKCKFQQFRRYVKDAKEKLNKSE